MPTATRRRDRVPQAAKAPKTDAEAEAAAAAAAEQEAAWTALVDRATSGGSSAAKQITRAISLEQERADVMKRIADNRDYLRLMDRNEELDEDQAEFLDTFYPEKERGERRSKEDIEATRKARESARKTSGAQS